MNPNIRPTRAAGRQIIAGAAFASMLLASCSGTSADTSAAQPAADTAATANEGSIATPGDQWEQVSPEDAGFDKAALDKLAENAEAASSNCLFVTKGGKLVGVFTGTDACRATPTPHKRSGRQQNPFRRRSSE